MSIHYSLPSTYSSRKGMTLVEVLVAISIGIGLIVAAVALIAPSLRVNTNSNNAQTVGSLSKELADNIRAWAGGGWNNVLTLSTSSGSTYYLNTSVSPFTAVVGTESVIIGSNSYQRYFTISDMYRDSSGNVTTTASGNNYDPSTKKITVTANAVTYDGTIGAWTLTSALNTAVRSFSSAVYRGYVYAVGGYDSGGGIAKVQYASINSTGSLNTWLTTTALPQSMYGNSVVAANSKIYSFGGTNGSVTSTDYYAPINSDGSVGSWVLATALPVGLGRGAAVVNGSYIYFVGGNDSTGAVTTTVSFVPINADGSLGAWSQTQSLPSTLKQGQANIVNGYIYVAAGINNSGVSSNNIYYAPINANGSIGTWITTATNNIMYPGAAAFDNGFIYASGYQDNSQAQNTSTVTFTKVNSDHSVGGWSKTSVLQSASSTDDQQMPANGDYIYSIGGHWVNVSPFVTSSVFFAKMNSTPGPSQTTSFYLTRNANNALDYTDWSGGSGQDGPSISTNSLFSTSTNISYSTAGSFALATTTAQNWISTTPLPTALYNISAIVSNGYVYTTGGNNGSGPVATVYYAKINSDGSLGAWATSTPLPIGLYTLSDAISGNYLYVTGGRDAGNNPTSTVNFALINSTGSIQNWISTGPLPNTVYNHSAVANNGYIYVTGGISTSTATSTVSYGATNGDGSISNWSSTIALPGAGLNEHVALVSGNYMYTIGGASRSGAVSTVNYAPINSTGSLGSWTSTTPLPNTLINHGAAITTSSVYVVGGYNAVITSTVFYAPVNSTGSVGSWNKIVPLPVGREEQGSIVYNGYLYAIAGRDSNNNPTSTVNYFPLTTTNYTASGTLDSTTFDFGSQVQLNSVLWQGTQPAGTTVQFQFAASNASSGPWSFIGYDGTSNTWYTPTGPNESQQLDYSLFNNYRYFRYRVYLGSDAAGTQSPTVNDVVVNWSP